MSSYTDPKPTETLNPGDKVPPKPEGSADQQLAVDAPDITGDHIKVPTYFEVEDQADGHKEKLHHIKDAEEITDVVRQARADEDGNREWR